MKEKWTREWRKIFEGKNIYIFFVSLVTKKSTNQGTNSLRFDPKREMSIEMQNTRLQLVNTGHVTHILQSDSLNFKIFFLFCSV